MEDKLDKLEQNRSFTPAEAQETPEETPDPFVKLEARYQELDEKIQKYCSPEERARIRTAFEFARDSHQGQLRKDVKKKPKIHKRRDENEEKKYCIIDGSHDGNEYGRMRIICFHRGTGF